MVSFGGIGGGGDERKVFEVEEVYGELGGIRRSGKIGCSLDGSF